MAHELVCPTCCPITGDLHAGVPPLYVDTSHVTFPKPSSRLQSDTFSIAHISTHVQSATSRNDRIFRDLKLPESLRTLKLCSSLEEEPEVRLGTRRRTGRRSRVQNPNPNPILMDPAAPARAHLGGGSTCSRAAAAAPRSPAHAPVPTGSGCECASLRESRGGPRTRSGGGGPLPPVITTVISSGREKDHIYPRS